MKLKAKIIIFFSIMMSMSLLFSACGGGPTKMNTSSDTGGDASNTSDAANTGDADAGGDGSAAGHFATVREIEGDVSLRAVKADAFASAVVGDTLYVNAQLQTGQDSRSRVDFEDGTIVRVGPGTTFTMTAIEDGAEDGGLLKKLEMELGKVWIILNGGTLDIETESGVASVTGSYLSLVFNPITGLMDITCLEGTCTLETDGGMVTLGAGETASVAGLDDMPDDGVMDDEDFQDWLDNAEDEVELIIEDIPGSVGNYVWKDLNGNGMQDDGEFGVPDVLVTLLDASGVIVDTTMTSADGFYMFFSVPSGDYMLVFTPPDGYGFTLKDSGGDDAKDSDANPDGTTDPFTTTGAPAGMWDAGLVEQEVSAVPTGPLCPLTGLPVDDPAYLELRPIAISMSHFPPKATRPPMGINFAPFVFELFIGEGQTRLLSIFYCGYPSIDFGQQGEADMPAEDNYPAVGNRVWGDVNGNGIQEEGEPGVPDIKVKLFKKSGELVGETFTDNGGYYFFDGLEPGEYYLTFNNSGTGYEFTYYQEGDDPNVDSDALSNGVTQTIKVEAGYLDHIDAGLVIVARIEGIRSGRVVYVSFIKYFNAGLIYQGADPAVNAVIGGYKCASASSTDTGDIGKSGIDVSRLQDVADECRTELGNPDLNVYEFGPMPDGIPYDDALELMVFYNIFNRTHWVYDPAYGGYVRYQNDIEESEIFTMSTDRMSGEPVVRSNVIVLFAKHDVQNPAGTIIDVNLDYTQGQAKLFRDGMVFNICWDTQPGSYSTESNRLRPILFTDCHGNILPLAPGSTWVVVMDTTAGFYYDAAKGWWYARFYTPEYQVP